MLTANLKMIQSPLSLSLTFLEVENLNMGKTKLKKIRKKLNRHKCVR